MRQQGEQASIAQRTHHASAITTSMCWHSRLVLVWPWCSWALRSLVLHRAFFFFFFKQKTAYEIFGRPVLLTRRLYASIDRAGRLVAAYLAAGFEQHGHE